MEAFFIRTLAWWAAVLFIVSLPVACGEVGGEAESTSASSAPGKADNTEGTPINFPVWNYAGYPFSPECYEVRVKSAYGYEFYSGKVKEIINGFTSKTKAEYFEYNDVPWENAEGELTHEGVFSITHAHDGGYKGSYQMVPPPAVIVPAGKNLVFKLRLDKFAGLCGSDNDTRWVEDTLTKTYFVETVQTYAIGWVGGLGSFSLSSDNYRENDLFNSDGSTTLGCNNEGISLSSYSVRAIRIWVPGLTSASYRNRDEFNFAAGKIRAEVYTNLSGTWQAMPAQLAAVRGNDFIYTFFSYNDLCTGGGPRSGARFEDGTYEYKIRFSIDEGQTWYWYGTEPGVGEGGEALKVTFGSSCSYFNRGEECFQ